MTVPHAPLSNPQMIQSCTMRFRLAIPMLLLAASVNAQHKQPSVQPATNFAAVEVHADEKVAIAVEPYETQAKASLFRVDYLAHGILPIRIIVTNNGERPINLSEARIIFYTASDGKILAAEPEDVERLMSRTEREGKKLPLPGGLPPIHLKPKASNKEIEQDFDAFQYSAIVVEPHTTRAGFLFYDINGIEDPLRGAKLHLRKIRNADGQDLFYFEIPFDKYLKSKSNQMN